MFLLRTFTIIQVSKSEEKFCTIFKKENIPFIREKTFSNLQKGILRFDFFLPSLGILIEYDSEIHFMKVPKFHKDNHDFHHA